MSSFRIEVDARVLETIHRDLERARFPRRQAGPGWTRGADLGFLRKLAAHWLERYDWRAVEARLNRFEQERALVDGERIHFLRERGSGPRPTPLVLLHG